jgi:putative endonuclease
MKKSFYVYMLTNYTNSVLYTGVTSNLIKRVFEHKAKLVDGFTNKYKINKLIYYEIAVDAEAAITREKQLKGGSRKQKLKLIHNMNKEWRDLYDELL